MVTRRIVLKLVKPAFTRTVTMELDEEEIYADVLTERASGQSRRTDTLMANGPEAIALLFDERVKQHIGQGYQIVSDERPGD